MNILNNYYLSKKKKYEENVFSVNQEFFPTEGMKNDVKKRPNFEKRPVFTRFSCHGFHFFNI
jgi:hypothetical protein